MNRERESTIRAVRRYEAGATVLSAAKAEGISPSTLNRALNLRGVVKRGAPRGPDHHAYIDGRKSAARAG